MADVRTDLAVEAHESMGKPDIPGIEIQEEAHGDVRVTRVRVETEEAASRLGKPVGHYITVESQGLRRHDREHAQTVGRRLSSEIARFVAAIRPQNILIVGLGNWKATPDALGPRVVGRLLVTRHLRGLLDDELERGLRTVSALAPGVLGLTGIETSEIVQGVADRITPDMVIAIDSLAASAISRIGTTVQVSDSGIHPGSGVGNRREGLTQEVFGVPVLAIGVPTVVHAMTVARGTVERLGERLGPLGALEDRDQVLQDVLGDEFGDLVVTPKEIDVMVEDLSKLIAGALNTALHPEIDLGEFALFA